MENDALPEMIKGFYPYAKKQLGFNKPAKIFLVSDKENAALPLGKTAYYDPEKMAVFAYVTGRHIKDILRSVSHELVHHSQNCSGKMKNNEETPEGYAQKDPHLRELEREAYERGNLIFRDFEDQLKDKKGIKVMSENKDKELNPLKREKANDHYAQRAERLYKQLMDRFNLSTEPKDTKKEITKEKE